jgi:hypothetical protein
MKKSAIPVEAFYILAYLIIMSLAGATLYFYIESQSLGPNYRISAASIIEESESIKKLIDQERLFVLETVIFFLGSQGGVSNINDYNAYNLTSIPASDQLTADCLNTLKSLNNNQYPSKEITSKCVTNNEYYNNPESLGVWKCDDKMYYYSKCDSIGEHRTCCESVDSLGAGIACSEACLLALDFDISNCADKELCGALWCKENNLEIPETFYGAQYYYKINEKYPGYFCPSKLSYNPENYYPQGELWQGLDKNSIMKNLIELSNDYFYMPNPDFKSYISKIYNRDLNIAFQLSYKGCSKDSCEFSWIPYGESSQSFEITGLGGIPMVKMSSDILSMQSINIPLMDMIDYSQEIIEERKIEDFFSSALKDNILINPKASVLPINILPSDWKNYFPRYGGTNSYEGIYDNSSCGQDYIISNNYDCLMQHASTKLYSAVSAPMEIERESGADFKLRPLFNFISSSIGGSINVGNDNLYSINLDSGKYSIFLSGTGNTSAKISLSAAGLTLPIGQTEYDVDIKSEGAYYEQAVFYDEIIGQCSYNAYLPGQTLAYYKSFGCCPAGNYNKSGCQVPVYSNAYCSQMNNKYSRSQIGSYCSLNSPDGKINYDSSSFELSAPTTLTLNIENLQGSLDSIEIIRMQYDNTLDTSSRMINGMQFNSGGSYEYYTDAKDCSSAVGAPSLDYSILTNDELWYSMLCLRSKGNNWINIVEDYTSFFNNFESKLGEYEKNRIDNFINKYKISPSNNGEVSIAYTNDCPAGGCAFQLKENPELLWSYEINEQMQTFAENEIIKNKLIEIAQNTDYLSLPIKWVFAYNDKVRINQTNPQIGDNAGCDLVYDSVKESAPDCGCKSDCAKELACNFDFSAIPMDNLISELYDFKAIFIDNQAYKNNEVVGNQ